MIYNVIMADKNARRKVLTPAQRTLEILGNFQKLFGCVQKL